MGFNRFSLLLALRLVVIFGALVLIVYLASTPGYVAATLLVVLVTVGLSYEVYSFVTRTNRELSRFLDAARYADFGQRFNFSNLGAGFEGLGETFTHILDRFREDRAQQQIELRHLKALLEHVPVPLISIYGDQRVVLWNNSARRLFGAAQVTRASDLAQFGTDFYSQVNSIQAGHRVLAMFRIDEMEQRLTVSASEITIGSQTERLISLQNIQTELDGVQLSAWQDLVRVLTHEMMNSITPVTSLARTAVDLVDDARSRVADQPDVAAELKDARDAVETVARRSDGLMNFVSSYRQLTRPPTPEKARFQVSDLFEDVRRIIGQDGTAGPEVTLEVTPPELDLFADRNMVEQILINLLQNARYAVGEDPGGRVRLSGHLNKRGRVILEVSDNGPGVPDEIVGRIFVPFFTTRREGSGVGLALSRQVMIAHGGSIMFANEPDGGARFTLVF